MRISDSSCAGGGGGGCGGGAMVVANKSAEDDFFGDPKGWPPGFRFHPTDEELILYYLKRKMCRRRLKLNAIADIDVYKCDPEELPAQSLLKTGDRQWFFFSPRDRKYPNGGRSNRATRQGYWKATGKDRRIEWNSRSVGCKKTLVFYRGRAPSGERTDWVMHEYTLDEEELKRCKTAVDCYALYKVYKKSGAGPKNGEQYGAPFREEDWADDSDLVEAIAPNHDQVQHLDNNVNGDKSLVDNPSEPQCDLLDEILGLIANESQTTNQPENGHLFIKDGADKGYDNSMMMGPSMETYSAEPSMVLNPSYIQHGTQYSFDVTRSVISHIPSNEAPEVSSASPYTSELVLPELDEDNFLEINDLLGPQPGYSDVNHADDSLFSEEPEFYFDAAQYLRDTEATDRQTNSYLYSNNPIGELTGHSDHQMQPNHLVYENEHVASQLWMHDQNCDGFVSSELNHATVAPLNSGTNVIHSGGSSGNYVGQQTHNQGSNNDDIDVDTWFSSAISSLLASVPTPPAIAADNAIINRAFERMSSFGRVRIPKRDAEVLGGLRPNVGRRNATRNGGYFFLSILVALCAICWLLMIGTTIKVVKTFVWKFISS
ncbi:hypothetical protein C5167_024473 [Papaver somniferum]|uniref:NAC domain-containing protein n=1 Tax=Papaver somniferum TaxID=3469 RepID=A0A4Y7JRR1_PAPSO|nr:NAC domain-containing protein 17-like [Papaver somniferum]RZC62722.1 hypothetical protein C5167_024473 [Papaver somniferum]